MRDSQARVLPKRVTETEDKRSRSFMTSSGMKTFRVLQPTVNNSSLAKYQTRSPLQPRDHSTPLPPNNDDTKSNKSRQSSAFKQDSSRGSGESSPKSPALGSTSSSPFPYYTNYKSSDFYHTRAFTPRSRSCTPPHLYMTDHVRKAAVQRVSSNSSRQTGISQKTEVTSDSIEVPSRFGKAINLPPFVKTNPHLKNKELTMGQKQYLWGIARIYSMSHMKTQVQQQYQALLDYEFQKRMQRLGITEREKVKEMKDYLRYKKFIKNYDRRIPRNLRSNETGVERSHDADHIHKHVIKGWTTDLTSRHRQTYESSKTTSEREEVKSQNDWEEPYQRGAHIYKHVIKGWTMDPNANNVYQRIYPKKKLEAESEDNEETAVYRVDIGRSGGKDNGGDVMKITRLYETTGSDEPEKLEEEKPSLEVLIQSAEANFL